MAHPRVRRDHHGEETRRAMPRGDSTVGGAVRRLISARFALHDGELAAAPRLRNGAFEVSKGSDSNVGVELADPTLVSRRAAVFAATGHSITRPWR